MSKKVTYFYRNNKAGYSIAKVMQTVTKEIAKETDIEEFFVPEHRAQFIHVLKNILYVFKHRNKKGINHITGDIHYCIIALIGCKTVLTIHDLSYFRFTKNKFKRWILRFLWFDIPLLLADRVVCISKTVEEELHNITKRKDIKIIYNALSQDFTPRTKTFNTNQPIILQIGTAWNKNIERLIYSLKDINCQLRIIGTMTDKINKLLDETKINYTCQSDLTHEQIVQEYLNCDIVAFCSLYEGFGMPIIEGNSVGRCIVTSNLDPMKEVAGDAAVLINPYDINSIREAFLEIISDENLQNKMIKKGIENASRFKVDIIASSYLNIYKELIE